MSEEESDEIPAENTLEKPQLQNAWQSYKAGVKYLWSHKYYFAVACAKGTGSLIWNCVEMVLIKVSGNQYRIGDDSSIALSIIYLSTGFGVRY